MATMTIEKPVIPAKVADAIEALRANGKDKVLFNFPTIKNLAKKEDSPYFVIAEYFTSSKENFDTYFLAITAGYEADLKPEEKIRNLFEGFKKAKSYAMMDIVTDILNLLEVDIEGVNKMAIEEILE